MIVRSLILIISVMTILVYGAGCAQKEPAGPAADYASLVDNLRAAGATVEPAGEIIQDFFSIKGKAIKVNGEDVG